MRVSAHCLQGAASPFAERLDKIQNVRALSSAADASATKALQAELDEQEKLKQQTKVRRCVRNVVCGREAFVSHLVCVGKV